MIKIISQTCNRCGVQSTGQSPNNTSPNLIGWATVITYRLVSKDPYKRSDHNVHICPACADDLNSFLTGDL